MALLASNPVSLQLLNDARMIRVSIQVEPERSARVKVQSVNLELGRVDARRAVDSIVDWWRMTPSALMGSQNSERCMDSSSALVMRSCGEVCVSWSGGGVSGGVGWSVI